MKIIKISNIKYNTNFKSSSFSYKNPNGTNNSIYQDKLYTTTFLFRDDIDWKLLIDIIEKTFINKDKVNVFTLACSDGSESYSLAIALSKIKNSQKYFPINASDIFQPIIEKCLKKEINLTPCDIKRLQEYSAEDFFEKDNYKTLSVTEFCYKPFLVKEELNKKVNFKTADILQEIKALQDKSNTVILCRNVTPYLSSQYVNNLVKLLSKKLKPNSLFITGSFDKFSSLNELLELYNFKKISKNIYQKI